MRRAIGALLTCRSPGGGNRAAASFRAPRLAEELQVTSADLWVGVPRGGVRSWVGANGARDPGDFELRVEHKAVPIERTAAPSLEAALRRIVAFFDAVLSDQGESAVGSLATLGARLRAGGTRRAGSRAGRS